MKVIEKRKYLRNGLNARARVVIFSQALNLMEEGSARVRNISPDGALISDLEIPSRSLPIAPFQLGLIIQEGPLQGLQATCSMTRFSNGGSMSLGLRIDKIGEKHRACLWNLVSLYKAI